MHISEKMHAACKKLDDILANITQMRADLTMAYGEELEELLPRAMRDNLSLAEIVETGKEPETALRLEQLNRIEDNLRAHYGRLTVGNRLLREGVVMSDLFDLLMDRLRNGSDAERDPFLNYLFHVRDSAPPSRLHHQVADAILRGTWQKLEG